MSEEEIIALIEKHKARCIEQIESKDNDLQTKLYNFVKAGTLLTLLNDIKDFKKKKTHDPCS